MRIAISATHCAGKSTLIEAFLTAHREYAHEHEAYEALQEIYGEEFPAEPASEDYFRQLEYHLGQLQMYSPGSHVIFERCAIDYLAYLQALVVLKRKTADPQLTQCALDLARESIEQLDLIVYLPLTGDFRPAEDEDTTLRRVVDTQLQKILLDDSSNLFVAGKPGILEVFGDTNQRLSQLEEALTA